MGAPGQVLGGGEHVLHGVGIGGEQLRPGPRSVARVYLSEGGLERGGREKRMKSLGIAGFIMTVLRRRREKDNGIVLW